MPDQNKTMKTLGLHLINQSRLAIIDHLTSEDSGNWKSGFLEQSDINSIEIKTGRKVRCSTESGEYFYRLE